MKKILITGITGQDGIFLTNNILNEEKNIKIIGISREKNNNYFFKLLNEIGTANLEKVKILNVDLTKPDEVDNLLTSFAPDYIYNLSGPSSVYESLKNEKVKTEIINIFNNLVSSLIKNKNFCNFFQASSSEMFGINNDEYLNEKSQFNPNSPYAKAKLENHMSIENLRTEYEWEIYSGIMFNHESEYRKNNYLFMKIINTAINISKGSEDNLTLGSTEYIRDWSYAKDVSQAVFKITNYGKEGTYVIGSGIEHKIIDIVENVFKYLKLNWEEHLYIDNSLLRKGDPARVVADPTKINKELNWKAKTSFKEILERCIEYRINNY